MTIRYSPAAERKIYQMSLNNPQLTHDTLRLCSQICMNLQPVHFQDWPRRSYRPANSHALTVDNIDMDLFLLLTKVVRFYLSIYRN